MKKKKPRLALRLPEADAQKLASALSSIQDVCSGAARAVPVPGECVEEGAVDDYQEAGCSK